MPGATRLEDSSGAIKRKAPYAPQRLDWESFLAAGGQKGKALVTKPPKPPKPEQPQMPTPDRTGKDRQGLSPMMSGQYPSSFVSGFQLKTPQPVATGPRGSGQRAVPQKSTAHGQLEKAWAGLGPLGQGEAYLASLPQGSLRLPPGHQVIPGYRRSAYDGSLLPAGPGDIGSYEVLNPQEVAAFTDMMIVATGDPNYQFTARDYVDWMNQGAGAGQATGPFDEEAWTGRFAEQEARINDALNALGTYMQGGGGGAPPYVTGGGTDVLTQLLAALQSNAGAYNYDPYQMGQPAPPVMGSPWAAVA